MEVDDAAGTCAGGDSGSVFELSAGKECVSWKKEISEELEQFTVTEMKKKTQVQTYNKNTENNTKSN